MAESKDSTPEVLFPKGDTPPWISEEERRLLTFALDTFGGPLSQFLLAGLGQEETGRRWRFTITYVSGGLQAQRQMEAIFHEPAHDPAAFPQGRDPLILLALLKLLLSGQPASYDLTYDRADVLSLLGWEDAGGVGREIDEAVERYSLMMFRWAMGEAELARNNLSSYIARESIISKYQTIDEEGADGQLRRVFNRVTFSQQFVEQLKRRSLFEFDWDGVDSIRRIIEH